MKQALLTFLLSIIAFQGTNAQVGFGQSEQFNSDWLFSLTDKADYRKPKYNDSDWRKLNLPHDWSIEGEASQKWASCTGYLPAGIAWYRKHFTLNTSEDKTYIYFEGIYNRSEVYLNGHLLGKRPNGYVSFMYDMTPYLRKGDNVLAIRVDHSRYADSRWYTGSGIYRDVWLVRAPKTHLSQWGTTYRLIKLNEDGSAVVEVEIEVDNVQADNKLHVSLFDAANNLVAEETRTALAKQALVLKVPNAHLWSLESPYLYTLKVNLSDFDSTQIAVGLRTLDFDPNHGFTLNGKNTKVKGVCLHHDAGVLGAAVPYEVWLRKVRELKRMGANAIRMSHNPQAPMLYDICDKEGMLVMDEASDEWEFPKRKWVEGWNQGKPAYEGSYDFFEEWIDKDVSDMVRRDRNHPSVFLWSIGNEVDYPNDPYSHPILDGGNAAINQPMFGGYKPDAPHAERIGKIAKRLAKIVRSIDTSRPVTGALAGVVMSNQTEYPEAVDVVGYNYTENRYDTDHKLYPDRIIHGSETGVGYDAWKAVRDREHIFGQFVWTGTDYLGESGRWPSRGLNTGLLDFASFRKPRGWFRAALWSDEPVTYIGTYPLMQQRNGRRGNNRQRNFLSTDAQDDWEALPPQFGNDALRRIVCYTNAPQARLLLNDSIVGEMKQQNDSVGIIYWDIPYQPGTLRAEGCDLAGNVLSHYEIHTAGEASALRVTNLLPEDDGEILQLLIEIVDEQGNRVKSSSAEITCEIDGQAELLGFEDSNNANMGNHKSNHLKAYRGQLVAYIRRNTTSPITIKFTSPGLPSEALGLLQ